MTIYLSGCTILGVRIQDPIEIGLWKGCFSAGRFSLGIVAGLVRD
jgi:hypothetical protein